MRIPNWSKLTSPELWVAWRAEFDTQADAEATAIWVANRLVKDRARSTKRKFYEVKDLFIARYQHSLIEGQIVRNEVLHCNRCGGSGCDRCDDGVYRSRILYCHRFMIENTRYSFHSYSKPSSLSQTRGEDKESYGGRFTDSEIRALRLPLSPIVRMMRYHAFSGWNNTPRPKLECPCQQWPGSHKPDSHHDYCRKAGENEGRTLIRELD